MKPIKAKIQRELKDKLGILVDQPTSGSGNTNDGNTARRFFSHTEIVSAVLG